MGLSWWFLAGAGSAVVSAVAAHGLCLVCRVFVSAAGAAGAGEFCAASPRCAGGSVVEWTGRLRRLGLGHLEVDGVPKITDQTSIPHPLVPWQRSMAFGRR